MQPFEDSVETPGDVIVDEGLASAIAVLGTDPIFRDTANRALLIKQVFGDHEAFLADTASDILANLQILAATWAKRPERALISVIRAMTTATEKREAIARVQDVLNVLLAELGAVPEMNGEIFPVMLTGSRDIPNPDDVLEAFVRILERLLQEEGDRLVVISGGAAGADQLWARAAIVVDVPFTLTLPNWAYAQQYGQIEAIDKLRNNPLCLGVTYAVERREVDPGEVRGVWGREKWWTDNFVRNDTMISAATRHVICHRHHPQTMLVDKSIKGGTAAAVRSMKRLSVDQAIYVSIEHPDQIVWVQL